LMVFATAILSFSVALARYAVARNVAPVQLARRIQMPVRSAVPIRGVRVVRVLLVGDFRVRVRAPLDLVAPRRQRPVGLTGSREAKELVHFLSGLRPDARFRHRGVDDVVCPGESHDRRKCEARDPEADVRPPAAAERELRHVVDKERRVDAGLQAEAGRVDEVHRVIGDVAVEVRVAAGEVDRVPGRPPAGLRVVVAGAEADEAGVRVIDIRWTTSAVSTSTTSRGLPRWSVTKRNVRSPRTM
jgi:hypothetical protein